MHNALKTGAVLLIGSAVCWLVAAMPAQCKGDERSDIAEATLAISRQPHNVSAYIRRGDAFMRYGQVKEAIGDYTAAIKVSPGLARAYGSRGIAYYSQDLYEKSISDYDKAIRINPHDIIALVNRANARKPLGQYWAAIADYNKAIESDPHCKEAYVERARQFAILHLYEYAIRDLSRAAYLDSEDACVYSDRGDSYAKLGLFDRAVQDYGRAFELDPVDAGDCGATWISGWTSGTRSTDTFKYICKTGDRVATTASAWLRFSEGLAAASDNEAVGYVNKAGQMVIKQQFKSGGEFHEGLAPVEVFPGPRPLAQRQSHPRGLAYTVSEPRPAGYIDSSGQFVIKPGRFRSSSQFSEGLAAVGIGDKYGFIDRAGKLVIPPQFSLAGNFCDGVAPILILDRSNEPRRSKSTKPFDRLQMSRPSGKYGFIDKQGKITIKPEFAFAGHIAEDFQLFEDDKTIRCVSYRLALEAFSDRVGFSNGLAPIIVGGKYGYINKTGACAIEPQFDNVHSFSDGLAPVLIGKKYGYIDTSGRFAIKPNFSSAGTFSDGVATVGTPDSTGVMK